MQKLALGSLPVVFALVLACGDDSPSTPTPTTTTTSAPTSVVSEFTLRASDCNISWSRPLTTLGDEDSFTIRFKPTGIPEERGNEWANTVEFWFDRLTGEREALGLVLVWTESSQWFIDFYQGGFGSTGEQETINIGGRFREVRMVRTAGVVEWLLDGVSVLNFQDTKPERMVHTRVVGAEALFQYESTPGTLKASSSPAGPSDCMSSVLPICVGSR